MLQIRMVKLSFATVKYVCGYNGKVAEQTLSSLPPNHQMARDTDGVAFT
jgi:hypothetical protein